MHSMYYHVSIGGLHSFHDGVHLRGPRTPLPDPVVAGDLYHPLPVHNGHRKDQRSKLFLFISKSLHFMKI